MSFVNSVLLIVNSVSLATNPVSVSANRGFSVACSGGLMPKPSVLLAKPTDSSLRSNRAWLRLREEHQVVAVDGFVAASVAQDMRDLP